MVDNSYYIGYTQNLEKRLNEHNNGKSKYTSRKMPWKLVYSETFDVKRDAILREKQLKKSRNTNYFEKIINYK